jgi:diacylglycerol kinase family enzyme
MANTPSSKSGFHLVINAHAGTVQQLGREVFEKMLQESSLEKHSIHFLEADEITKKIRELKKTGIPVLVGGGDGTLAHAAKEFIDTPDMLGILPLGTMNLLAQDLNIPTQLDKALEAYAQGTRKTSIDVGTVNDKPFLCCVGLGVMPEASAFREQNRGQPDLFLLPRLTLFVFNQFDRLKRRHLKLTLDGKKKRVRTSCLIVSNNLYTNEEEFGVAGFQKESLRDGTFGVYTMAPRSLWDRIRLLIRLRLGDWKKDPVLDEQVAKHVIVNTHRKSEKVSLDGELHELKTPLTFAIKPRALRLILPSLSEPAAMAAE